MAASSDTIRRVVGFIPLWFLASCGTMASSLPPGKQADLDRQNAALASAQAANEANGITKAQDPGPPTGPSDTGVILDPHFPAGAGTVFETSDPAPGSDAVIINRWYENKGDSDFVTVFAGRDALNDSEGLLLVTYGMPGDLHRFDAPGAHGALRIVGAAGDVLAIRATDGHSYQFDVSALAFR